jgi:hypothetical protein
MSDYNNPNNFDKYGNPIPGPGGLDNTRPFAYEPVEANSRAPYVLAGLVALIALIGGAMYFTPHRGPTADVATAPPSARDTMTAPMTPPGPAMTRTAPAPTTTPAPAGPPATTTQQ